MLSEEDEYADLEDYLRLPKITYFQNPDDEDQLYDDGYDYLENYLVSNTKKGVRADYEVYNYAEKGIYYQRDEEVTPKPYQPINRRRKIRETCEKLLKKNSKK